MATIHLDPRVNYSEQPSLLRRPFFAAIRWGGVLAGVAVGVSVQLVLTLLGIASGLSATNVSSGETIGMGPLIWAGISMLIAAFIGAYVAARMSGLKRKADGILHGVVSWAVTTLLFAMLATSAGGALMSGIFSNMMGGTGTAMSGGSTMGGGLAGMLQRLGVTNVTPAALQTLQGHIQNGRRDEAVQYMSSAMGVEPSRAATIVDQALILSGAPEQASPQGRATADRAIDTASTTAWTVFLAVTLSLALGVAGGALGANNARRTSWPHNGTGTDDTNTPRTDTTSTTTRTTSASRTS